MVIKAFSIYQLLILKFVEVPRVCFSADLAYKQFMLVLNRLDSSGFVKLAFIFFVGQYSYGYAMPKNSSWTESMNMRLSGVTITFFRNFVG